MNIPQASPFLPQATVFFCHGSRNAGWRAPFDALAADFRHRLPEQKVRLAFLELMSPRLPEVLGDLAASGVERVRVVPLFLAPGAHTSRDLPALVDEAQRQWPALQVDVTPSLLESAELRGALVRVLADAANPTT